MRIALGAGRARVLFQLVVESCVLACLGAGAGLLLANWGVKALMASSPITFPSYIHPGLDPRVALFTVLISCAVGVLLGLTPAAQISSGNLYDAFKQASSHSADHRGGRRFRGALVVAEVAFAMLLLVGAGLMIRSVQQLTALHPGYDTEHVLTLRVNLPRLAPPAACRHRSAGRAHRSDRPRRRWAALRRFHPSRQSRSRPTFPWSAPAPSSLPAKDSRR